MSNDHLFRARQALNKLRNNVMSSVLAQAHCPKTQVTSTEGLLPVRGSLDYRVSSRTARAIQRNPVLEKPKSKKPK